MTATRCPFSTASSAGTAAWRVLTLDIVRRLAPVRRPSRALGLTALVFVASTLVHLVVWAVDGGGWGGPVSWRKPVVFSISFAAISWSLAWLLDRLPPRRLAWAIVVPFALSSFVEVGLIAMQTWRGRASHFNSASEGDDQIFLIMGAMAGVISLCLVVAFVWSLVERPAARIDRLAIYAGFGLVMSGLGVGQWMITLGTAYVNQVGVVPEKLVNGEAGGVSYPHGVAFHGVQVFMVAVAVAGALGLAERSARRMLRLTVLAYGGLMGVALTQAVVGRPITDFVLMSWAFLAVSIVAGVFAARTLVQGINMWRDARSERVRRSDEGAVGALASNR